MLDVRHLTTGVLVLTTLGITATSTNALLPGLVLGSRDKLKSIKVTQGKFTTVNVTYTELIP